MIESLTGHASPDVQAASIQLIAVTPTRPGDLPAAFWQAILQADAPEIRIASMILLARLDDAAPHIIATASRWRPPAPMPGCERLRGRWSRASRRPTTILPSGCATC